MRTNRLTRYRVELGVLAGIAVLIGAEAGAVIGGFGSIFAVVALGYLLVLGTTYWLYRQARVSNTDPDVLSQRERQVLAEMRVFRDLPDGYAEHLPAGLWERTRTLIKVDIFEKLTANQIDRIASLGQPVEISAGQVLGMAGEPGHSLFVIIQGKAQLSAHSAIGDITVRIAGAGESFPLAALLGSGTLITSVKAMTDMQLLAIPRTRLLAMFAQNPEIGMHIYEAIADVLSLRYWRTLVHVTENAEGAVNASEIWANV